MGRRPAPLLLPGASVHAPIAAAAAVAAAQSTGGLRLLRRTSSCPSLTLDHLIPVRHAPLSPYFRTRQREEEEDSDATMTPPVQLPTTPSDDSSASASTSPNFSGSSPASARSLHSSQPASTLSETGTSSHGQRIGGTLLQQLPINPSTGLSPFNPDGTLRNPAVWLPPANFDPSAAAASDSSSGKQKSHAKKRDDGHIKRPAGPFMLFRSHVLRSKLIPQEFGITRQQEVSRVLSPLWGQTLTEGQRKAWYTHAEKVKAQHAIDNPGYGYRPSPKTKTKKRKPQKDDHDKAYLDLVAKQIILFHEGTPEEIETSLRSLSPPESSSAGGEGSSGMAESIPKTPKANASSPVKATPKRRRALVARSKTMVTKATETDPLPMSPPKRGHLFPSGMPASDDRSPDASSSYTAPNVRRRSVTMPPAPHQLDPTLPYALSDLLESAEAHNRVFNDFINQQERQQQHYPSQQRDHEQVTEAAESLFGGWQVGFAQEACFAAEENMFANPFHPVPLVRALSADSTLPNSLSLPQPATPSTVLPPSVAPPWSRRRPEPLALQRVYANHNLPLVSPRSWSTGEVQPLTPARSTAAQSFVEQYMGGSTSSGAGGQGSGQAVEPRPSTSHGPPPGTFRMNPDAMLVSPMRDTFADMRQWSQSHAWTLFNSKTTTDEHATNDGDTPANLSSSGGQRTDESVSPPHTPDEAQIDALMESAMQMSAHHGTALDHVMESLLSPLCEAGAQLGHAYSPASNAGPSLSHGDRSADDGVSFLSSMLNGNGQSRRNGS